MIWLLLTHLAFADIVVETDSISQGQPITFQVLDSVSTPIRSTTVRVQVRPGLSSAEEWTIGITDQDGRVVYTPQTGGPHRLIVGDDMLPFQVRWANTPLVSAFSLAALAVAPLVLMMMRRRRERQQ